MIFFSNISMTGSFFPFTVPTYYTKGCWNCRLTKRSIAVCFTIIFFALILIYWIRQLFNWIADFCRIVEYIHQWYRVAATRWNFFAIVTWLLVEYLECMQRGQRDNNATCLIVACQRTRNILSKVGISFPRRWK